MKKLIIFLFASLLFAGCAKDENILSSEQTPMENPYLLEDTDMLEGFSKSVTDTALTEIEKAGLTYMREEEKLARDVYVRMYEKYNVRIFNNISRSENAHSNAIKYLLNYYRLPDPALNTLPGVFVNQDLQALYNQLVERGNISLDEALATGRDIEILDIQDLEEKIAQSTHANIKRIYNNLKAGSERHLRAFTWAINN